MHYFAPIESKSFPDLDGLVLFELMDSDGDPVVLEIIFSSFAEKISAGDHLYLEGVEAVKINSEKVYGIQPSSWRPLTTEEKK